MASNAVLAPHASTFTLPAAYLARGPMRQLCLRLEPTDMRSVLLAATRISAVLIDTAGIRHSMPVSSEGTLLDDGDRVCMQDYGLARQFPRVVCFKQSDWPRRRCTVSEDSIRKLRSLPCTLTAAYDAIELSATATVPVKEITFFSGSPPSTWPKDTVRPRCFAL